jgi:phage repressor protein C with HTH and peptisase S24 domain
LTSEEKAAIQSFDKMNILAFKSDSTQLEKYNKEISEVKSILKDDSYQQLMKAGSGSDGAAIYFVGNDDEHIEEFVVLAGKKENGFAVVRVLGNDMNPTHIMNMLTLLQKSNVDLEQLKPLQQLMK